MSIFHFHFFRLIRNIVRRILFYSFVSLFEDDADVAQKILQYPRYYLPLCDEAAIKAQEEIAKPKQIVKKKVMPRSHFVIKIYSIFIVFYSIFVIGFLKYT